MTIDDHDADTELNISSMIHEYIFLYAWQHEHSKDEIYYIYEQSIDDIP